MSRSTMQPSARRSDRSSADSLRGATRALLWVFVVFTAVAFNQLFVLAEHTEDWFSWTINPPLTAAFLGAGYAAGFVLVVLSLLSDSWSQARIPVLTVLIFAVLTLVATLTHLDKFHFEAPGSVARFAAWFWLAVYIAVPVALGCTVFRQRRHPTAGRPAARWLQIILAVQGLVLLAVGSLLFLNSAGNQWIWSWTLTPLTGQVVAAWLIAFGTGALLTLWEQDLRRLRISFIGYAALGALQFLALALYGADLRWDSPAATGYVVALSVAVITGVVGWWSTTAADDHLR